MEWPEEGLSGTGRLRDDAVLHPSNPPQKTLGAFMHPVDINLQTAIGFRPRNQPWTARQRRLVRRRVDLALLQAGLSAGNEADKGFSELTKGLIGSFREKARLLSSHRCPADLRIESFLRSYLADLQLQHTPTLPPSGVVLTEHGIARELSLPERGDESRSSLLSSYRVKNGVLNNPKADRRTTAGTFHVAEGGLPVPADKRAEAGVCRTAPAGRPAAGGTAHVAVPLEPSGRAGRQEPDVGFATAASGGVPCGAGCDE
jgi:hypothetical protein